MDHFCLENLSRIIDISCVKQDDTTKDLDRMIAAAIKYDFICAFALPAMTPYLTDHLKGTCSTMIGGTVGFPAGCDSTESKVFQAGQMLSLGCKELDMVINIAQLKSGNTEFVFQDIKAVVDTASGIPVKTILEVALLTDEEIVTASKTAEAAGAAYIKTGTGWCSSPTQLEHIHLIRSAIQPQTKLKAAGGIRSLTTLLEMRKAGCDRFGISVPSALCIMEEAAAYPEQFRFSI